MSYTSDIAYVKSKLIILENLIRNIKMPGRPSATTNSTVAAVSNAAFTILAANNRMGYKIYNPVGADLYVKEGSGASSSSFSYKIASGQLYESPYNIEYSGIITGRLASSSGDIQVTEYTA